MKHLLTLLCIMTFGFLFYASSPTKNSSSAPTKQTFVFDYKTASINKPGSANMLVSLVRPRYANKFAFANSELFTHFREFMEKDIEELLIDKGYRVKGPYSTFDDMVFDDRKESDIALDIEIEPEFTARDGDWHSYTPITFTMNNTHPSYYYYQGTASLIGKINIVGYEPLSKEKIWVISVPIPSIQNIDISTSGRDFISPQTNNAFFNDPAVYNSLGKALSQEYNEIFKKIDAHVDPQEFNMLRQQIKELKSKKGY